MLESLEYTSPDGEVKECPFCDTLVGIQEYRRGIRFICHDCGYSTPSLIPYSEVEETLKIRVVK